MELENNAQTDFNTYLENTPAQLSEINISVPLYGDLDLNVLTEYGITNITQIKFANGGITSIKNIPSSVTSLICPYNQLHEMTDLPINLVEIDVQHNNIHTIDVSKLIHLKTINVSHNQLTSLDNLPANIETIMCDNNQIKRIDLSLLIHLQVLHCANNPFIQVLNPPSTLHDFVMDKNTSSEIINQTGGGENDSEIINSIENNNENENLYNKKEYLESLHAYFKLKNKYDTLNHQKRKDIYKRLDNKKDAEKLLAEFKPKCIHCKRPVGTIFAINNRHYLAKCGDVTNPCTLDIDLYAGFFHNIYQDLDFFKDGLETVKKYIIRQKLDTLFNYLSEDDAVKDFKSNLETYNESSVYYNDVHTKYQNVFFNENIISEIRHKQAEIKTIIYNMNEIIDSYKETNEPQFLKDYINMHIRELTPAVEHVRRLKYPTMEMVPDLETTFSADDDKTKITFQNMRLFQLNHKLNELDFTFSELPEVIKYNYISA